MKNKEDLLAEFRHHYYKRYRVQLDDDVLYLLIRMNELNVSVNKDNQSLRQSIDKLYDQLKKQVVFKNRWDYFLYGLGKNFLPAILFSSVLLVVGFHFNDKQSMNNTKTVIYLNEKKNLLEISNSKDSVLYYVPLKKRL